MAKETGFTLSYHTLSQHTYHNHNHPSHNTPCQFGDLAASYMAKETGFAFTSAANKFTALASHDNLVNASAALRTLSGE